MASLPSLRAPHTADPSPTHLPGSSLSSWALGHLLCMSAKCLSQRSLQWPRAPAAREITAPRRPPSLAADPPVSGRKLVRSQGLACRLPAVSPHLSLQLLLGPLSSASGQL